MKTQVPHMLSIGILTLSTILVSSCDLLDKADDVNFDTTLEETIYIQEGDEGSNVTYTETILIDATSDPDVNEYKDKITGFTVKKVSYQIVSFDGTPGTTFSGGSISFGDASTTTATVVATIANLNFQTAFAAQTIFDLPINQADIDKIGNLLKDDKAVKIYLNGQLSETPVYVGVRIILEVSVKADAL